MTTIIFINSNMYTIHDALCSWFSGESVVVTVTNMHFQSWMYLFLQISVVDGFFFKAFSRLIENNLRKRKAIDRHVSRLFANLMQSHIIVLTSCGLMISA